MSLKQVNINNTSSKKVYSSITVIYHILLLLLYVTILYYYSILFYFVYYIHSTSHIVSQLETILARLICSSLSDHIISYRIISNINLISYISYPIRSWVTIQITSNTRSSYHCHTTPLFHSLLSFHIFLSFLNILSFLLQFYSSLQIVIKLFIIQLTTPLYKIYSIFIIIIIVIITFDVYTLTYFYLFKFLYYNLTN